MKATEMFEAINEENVESPPKKNGLTMDHTIDGTKIFPSSFVQQRLWFLDQLQPGNPAYNAFRALRLRGPLHIFALEKSIQEVVRRHESLRTTLRLKEGQVIQVVSDFQPILISLVDLSSFHLRERETRLQQTLADHSNRPFDLAQGPLLRIHLIRISEDDHVLALAIHQSISDPASFDLFFKELSTLYSAFVGDEPSPLSELSLQYGEYAASMRAWLQGEVLEKQLSYWKKQLSGNLPLLELPVDRRRPAFQFLSRRSKSLTLSPELTAALQKLCQRQGTTLFMTLLAAFQALLHRYSRQEDIVVGSPIAGRNRRETEGMIGALMNTLVLRADLSGNPTFLELLERVRLATLGALEHQDLPFERLVDELQPQRDQNQSPLFQAMFDLQSLRPPTFEFKGIQIELMPNPPDSTLFDLTLTVNRLGEGLETSWIYSADLFDASTIDRMTHHFENLLEGIVADPTQLVSKLPLLTASERKQLLIDWNETETHYRPDETIHERFESQARHTPDAVAISYEGATLTYRELNERANQIAHYLKKRGVGPEILVGLCVERSLEMVAGILGILKAGGAYLPLDPVYPKDRLSFILKDAEAPILLTQKRLLSGLPAHVSRVICLDEDAGEIAKESAKNPGELADAESLAYVIYTSGSTGKPKGTLVTHYNVVRLFQATEGWFHFGEKDVWTLFHSHAFDFSVWEIWGALLYGGKLVVVPYLVSRSPEAFYSLLKKEGVTVLNQTPSAFRQLIQVDEATRFDNDPLALRYVIFGGEALEFQSLKSWFERHGDEHPQLINMYGITETTVHVSYRPVKISDVGSGSLIGEPIPDLQIYILDPHLEPTPIGVAGEIYVGGMGVARGYLNRPELNAEKFIPDRFRQKPGERLYRSGDLARYMANGDIEYLGRIDHQIKIRGYRIELGEIETRLMTHPNVRETVVLALDDAGDKRLIAYLVARKTPAPSTQELRAFLKQHLPEYMVPSAFVALDQMPLTAHGKVDRRTLAVIQPHELPSNERYVAPRNELEMSVAKIWSEVLNVPKVGIRDNFFDLGGHSMMAVRLFAQIKKQLGLDFPLSALFEHPNIEQLVKLKREKNVSQSCLVPIQPLGNKSPIFWVHTLGGDSGGLFRYKKIIDLLGTDQPSYGIRAPQEPFTDFHEMSAHYIEQIRKIQPSGPYFLVGYCFGGNVAFEMAQQLRARGEEVAFLALLEAEAPAGIGRHFTWSGMGHFAANFYYWLCDFLQQKPGKMVLRIRNKVKRTARHIGKKIFRFKKDISQMEVEAFLNELDYPVEHRKHAQAHWQALYKYVPKPYPGHMTLFRVRKQRLACFNPSLGWDELARDGANVKIIPGSHERVFDEPHIKILAEQIQSCLDQIHAKNDVETTVN